MKSQTIYLSLITSLLLLLFTVGNSEAQNTGKFANLASDVKVEVIQFHSEHRCMTCNKIESFTKETINSYPSLTFSLINVDDAKNEKKAERFEATGTALFLYNPKTGKKKDLTDFAFMNVRNKDKFIDGLKKEIDLFLKS